MAFLLLESGSRTLLEDGSSRLLLEGGSSPVVTLTLPLVVRRSEVLARRRRLALASSPGGNPTVPPRRRIFAIPILPASPARRIRAASPSGNPTLLPPRLIAAPPYRPRPRPVPRLLQTLVVSVAQHGPMPQTLVVRITPGPGRARPASWSLPMFAPGQAAAAGPYRMNPYAAVLLSDDLDPLAVDPLSAVRTR